MFSDEEINTMKLNLDNPSIEFCYVLLNTGLRLNELFSLQAVNLEADLENLKPLILKPFYTLGKTIYGYIHLESQMQNPEKKYFRDKKGHISRKPLKCRKAITAEDNRIVPITDKLTWEILLKLRRFYH